MKRFRVVGFGSGRFGISGIVARAYSQPVDVS